MAQLADRDSELAEAFAKIARQLQAQDSPEQTWQRLVEGAADQVPEVRHAGITLVHQGGRVDTAASTGDVPRIVDRIQYDTSEGPCLDAVRQEQVFVTGNLADEHRWPQFTRRAVEETGIRSMLSFQLFVDEGTLGALNLYSEEIDAFGERARAFGGVLAAHGAIAMSAATEHRQVEHLEKALDSSREIGMAIGILIVQSRTDRHQAFAMLREGSQRTNVKVRDLAARIVAGAETKGSADRARPARGPSGT